MDPLVTIIVRTQEHRGDYLERSLASIDAQTHTPIEVVVVEDGSDVHAERVAALAARPGRSARHIPRVPAVGRARAANTGLDQAAGEYVGFLDDDDELYPDHCATLVKLLRDSPAAAGAYAAADEVQRIVHGTAPLRFTDVESSIFYRPSRTSFDLLDVNLFPIQAVLFRRALLDGGPRMHPELDALEDWLFWQQLFVGRALISTPAVTSRHAVPFEKREESRRKRAHREAEAPFARARAEARFSFGLEDAMRLARIVSITPTWAEADVEAGQTSADRGRLEAYLKRKGRRLQQGRAATLSDRMLAAGYRAVQRSPGLKRIVRRLVRSPLRHLWPANGAVTPPPPPASPGGETGSQAGRSIPDAESAVQRAIHRSPEETADRRPRGGRVVFTSANLAYLPKARILAESVKRHHDDVDVHLLLNDELPPWLAEAHGRGEESFDRIVPIGALPIADKASWMFRHNVVELCTATKPLYLERLLEVEGSEKVMYLDPDIVVFQSLDELFARLDAHAALLTPHCTEPGRTDDEVLYNEISCLAHGIYNLGFLAVANRDEGRAVASFWKDRVYRHCYGDVHRGLFTDQKWADHLPVFFDGVKIVKDAGCNVASWNIARRPIRRAGETLCCGDEPVVFFHFSGFDNDIPERMFALFDRGNPALTELLAWYTAEVGRHRLPRGESREWIFNQFSNGQLITQGLRNCYRMNADLQSSYPEPYAASGESFFAWLHEEGIEDVERRYYHPLWVRRHY